MKNFYILFNSHKIRNCFTGLPKEFQPAGENNAWKYLESFSKKEVQTIKNTFQSQTKAELHVAVYRHIYRGVT